jgi:glu-tRNAGln amidotransferase C subunit
MAQNSKITPEVFENLLYLSRLSPADSDRESLAGQVGQIVEYFDILKKYDVSAEADDGTMISEGSLRSDTIAAGIAQSDLKKMSSEYMDGYFRVPKVLGSGV